MSQPNLQVRRTDFAVPAEAASWQRTYLIVGVVGAIACIAGFVLQPEQFLRGYLIGFMLWLGLSLGCMALLMVQHLSGGLWGISIRRILEASSKGLPMMAVLFLPILFGRNQLYPWMTDSSLTEHNSWYLNTPGWILRFLLYFATWIGMELVLNKRSAQQDEPLTASNFPRFQLFSGIGLLLYALSISFASVDWVMSLDPHWGSTIYGMIFMAGEGLSALAFCIIMLTVLTGYSPFREIIKPEQFRDLGKLMLAFVMLFAYFSFSQWLIIWAGNLPEEISWFLNRIHGGWGIVALMIILFHFALPFALLLSKERKKDGRRLIWLAVLLMFMRLVDIYWYVVPNFAHARGHFYFSVWYLVAPVGIGGLWLAFFFYNLRQRPLLPIYEPQVPSLLNQGSGHGH
ncbi:MAG TPA: hypothetical protein VFC15_16605 [Candidatus Limnocylindrales bacterium]|nr:hypothetical protein [Candidatus Limnocylindrales bacterium]